MTEFSENKNMEIFTLAKIAEIKHRKIMTDTEKITQWFLVNVTMEKPPTTLGENQFESSSLFLKNAFT